MDNNKVKKSVTQSKISVHLSHNRNFSALLRHNRNNKKLVQQLDELKKPESNNQTQPETKSKPNLTKKEKEIKIKDEIKEVKEIKMKEKEKEDEEEFQELLEEEIDPSLICEDEPLSDEVIIKQLFNHYIKETNSRDIKLDDDNYSIKHQPNYYKSKYIGNRRKVINKLLDECIVSVDEMTMEKLVSYGYDTRYFNEVIPLVEAVELLKFINSPQETVKLFVILETILLFNNNIRGMHSINTHELSLFKKRLESDISVLVNEINTKYIYPSNNNKKFLVNSFKLESPITKNYYDEIIKNTSFFKVKDTFNQLENLSIRCPDVFLKQEVFKQLNYCGKNSNLYPPEMSKLKSLHIQGHYVNQKLGWKGSNRLLIEYILKQSVKNNQIVDFSYDIMNASSVQSDSCLLDNNIIQTLVDAHNDSLNSITFRLLSLDNVKTIKSELSNLKSLINKTITNYPNIKIIIENSTSESVSSPIIKLVNETFKDINYNIKQTSNLEVIRFEFSHK
ncbi:hypothetical protein DICPUDRAFT_158094 [Dictyostelium purpureum]|uniref:Uncharacterized protein n=1 Tax=Dictyostelium purpureum TaxID=5786 RepID=F1A0T8_DICPU|nr:uncharacterized protein DICPUDRAFT_158094 [Dictyostelium purpureum]EGC30196.1 hypothetical protein DICPUDRAFT_158094 [Dictyostelium purpureum]|eukprot:XP_003293285.1 hypothetical protein DICPUDRAFT_158094 [Dictyostelium purpureum]